MVRKQEYIDNGYTTFFGGTSSSSGSSSSSGGVGSHSIISSRNKTGVTLPDYIVVDWASDLLLAFIDDDQRVQHDF